MSPRDQKTRLNDISTCSRNILSFIQGMTIDSFLDDPKTIRAVAFELTTIGEAVRSIPSDFQNRYPNVPWGKMLGMRNVLIHEYYKVDEEILWETCQKDIPRLLSIFEQMLKEEE